MTATDSYLLLRALVDELARCGMRHACTCPGSRNTPIVLTLAREPRVAAFSHIDERSAGFFALGAAKVSGLPVAVTCTSGTAAANLLPAVIEARQAGVPLIVLTADRPPELRDIGAGQTIDQLKLYGPNVKWFFELGVHQATPARLRWIRALACRAYLTACAERPGPVHLNIPLPEPLVLERPLPEAEPGGGGRRDGRPWVTPAAARPVGGEAAGGRAGGAPTDLQARAADEPPADPQARLAGAATAKLEARAPIRTVLVAGDLGPDRDASRRLAALAARARVPLLADPLSGARSGDGAIARYDLILRDPDTAAALTPELLIRVGELPTSKPLRAWIERLDATTHVQLASSSRWSDPASRTAIRCVGPLAELLDALERRLGVDRAGLPDAGLLPDAGPPDAGPQEPGLPDAGPQDAGLPDAGPQDVSSLSTDASSRSGWLERWKLADRQVEAAVRRPLEAAGLCEPAVASALARQLPSSTILFVAASMPIRDVEEFFPALAQPPRVLSNRGANGLDGTVSSAFGAAGASGGEVVLLIGDVALAHNVGGLLAASRCALKLTVVLINNGGGGIFSFLPVAREGAPFERHIATPTGLDFSKLAALYKLAYRHVRDLPELARALGDALAGTDSTLIEVRTDRRANRVLHAEIEAAARHALASGR